MSQENMGLQCVVDTISGSTALQSLAAVTSVNVSSALGATKEKFLAKRCEMDLVVSKAEVNDTVMLFIAPQGAAASVYDLAIESQIAFFLDPDDPDNIANQAIWKTIIYESIRMAQQRGTQDSTSGRQVLTPVKASFSLGGGKGWLFQDAHGPKLMARNNSSVALGTGIIIDGFVKYYGVFIDG